MPIKNRIVQDCEGVLDGCRVTRHAASAARLTGTPAPGRETSELRPQTPSVTPDERALHPVQVGEMINITPDSTRLFKRKHHTEIHIREGSAPFRVLVYPYRVEIEVRPAPRRRAA